MITTKGYFFLILFLGILVAGSFYWSSQKRPEVSNLMEIFHQSAIYGKLSHIEIKYKMIYFSVVHQKKYYLFSPVTSELNDNKEFYHNAKRGDLIIKPSYSDTLTLITKDGKKYQYTFRTLVNF
jgi:hypothetical protein